jgi:hypothetical protein
LDLDSGSTARAATSARLVDQWCKASGFILFIPVFRVGTYRVKYVAPNRFVSRELPKKPKV